MFVSFMCLISHLFKFTSLIQPQNAESFSESHRKCENDFVFKEALMFYLTFDSCCFCCNRYHLLFTELTKNSSREKYGKKFASLFTEFP